MLTSKQFRLVFQWSACSSLAVGVFAIVVTALYEQIVANSVVRLLFQVLGACLGVVGTVSTLVIVFGMLLYLFRHDRSSAVKKLFWCGMIFCTACFGASLYYFVVYRRQVREIKETGVSG